MRRVCAVAVAAVLLLGATEASAAAQRTFVSSTGSDLDPCSVSAPCRSFGAAMGQTLPGGEIIPLDSAGYGNVVITQSVTIAVPPGIHAAITASSSNGIDVQAAATDVVVLRGLTLESLGSGGAGIDVVSAGAVHVEDCDISGFLVAGVSVHTSAPVFVSISDTTLHENESGVVVTAVNTSAAASRVEIWRTRARDNHFAGFVFADIQRVGIIDSDSGGNQIGLRASGTPTSTTNPSIAIDRMTIADNTDAGLFVVGGPGIVSVVNAANSTITANQTGLLVGSNGVIRFTTSQLTGNGTAITLSGNGVVDSLTTNMNYGNNAAGNAPTTLAPN
jgi:hypothetical protein